MSKYIYIIFSVILFITIIIAYVNLFYPTGMKYFQKFDLLISEPNQVKIIFSDEDEIDNKYNSFFILEYDSKKFNKIIKNNNAKKISNASELKNLLEKNIVPHLYDNSLIGTKNHRLWLYEQSFSYDLINNNNYYLYLREEHYVCIMIFDTSKNIIYVFENNYN